MCTSQPSMLLVSGLWNSAPTFRMIPMSKECPFVEGIYDARQKVLVLMSPITKDTLHMVPRLDDNGQRKFVKGTRDYQEQRITLATFQEYYVSKPEEIVEAVKKLAINPEFDIDQFMNPPVPDAKPEMKVVKDPDPVDEALPPVMDGVSEPKAE